jgi:hypothetical protein
MKDIKEMVNFRYIKLKKNKDILKSDKIKVYEKYNR